MSWKKFKSLHTQSQKLLLRLILTQKKSQAHAELWVNKYSQLTVQLQGSTLSWQMMQSLSPKESTKSPTTWHGSSNPYFISPVHNYNINWLLLTSCCRSYHLNLQKASCLGIKTEKLPHIYSKEGAYTSGVPAVSWVSSHFYHKQLARTPTP